MARGIRRTDTSGGRHNRQIRELWAAIRELRSAKRVITNITVPVGDSGGSIFNVGDMEHGDRGLQFIREDGTLAFVLRKLFASTDPQTWRFFDRNGGTLVSENALGVGLGRPLLEHPFQPVATSAGTALTCGPYGIERGTTSATFETLFAYDGKAQNMLLDFKFAAICSDATTAGEVQVVNLDTGTPQPGFALAAWLGVVPAGSDAAHLILNPLSSEVVSRVTDVGAGGYQRLGVQARRTAGAGTVTLSVLQSIGG